MKREVIRIIGIMLAIVMMFCVIPAMGQNAYEPEEEQTDIVGTMEELTSEELNQTYADEAAVEAEDEVIPPDKAEVTAAAEAELIAKEEAEVIAPEDAEVTAVAEIEVITPEEDEVITEAETEVVVPEDAVEETEMIEEENEAISAEDSEAEGVESVVLEEADDAEDEVIILEDADIVEPEEPEELEELEEPDVLLTSIVASGTCGENLTWELDEEWTLTISGTGAMYDYNFISIEEGSTAPWISEYGKTIRVIDIEDGVTNIGNAAFCCMDLLYKVTIPNSLTKIGEYVLYRCGGLDSITIPESVTSIGSHAFDDCYNMSEITIPKSVTRIEEETFRYCEFLDYVYYSGTLEEWNAITIEDGNEYLTDATIYCTDGVINEVISGTCGENLSWTLSNTGTLTIFGSGAMYDYDYISAEEGSTAPWNEYRTDIQIIVFEEGVTTIGNAAFSELENVWSIAVAATPG